jgi:hypothetical protein
VFSLRQGWKYDQLEDYDFGMISKWLNMVLVVEANLDIDVYSYLLNWIAFILQNPGSKTKTGIVLKGLQRIGKGRFTDTIAELTAGYSNGNINKWDYISGTFNALLNGMVFINMNEANNNDEGKRANFNTLKSIVTEHELTINEKNVPKVTSENVVNFCLTSNNEYPIVIEKGDGRYLICECNPEHKGDQAYWNDLCKDIEDRMTNEPKKEFYDNLFTFFMKRDISMFEPSLIPMTEGKVKLTKRSLGGVDRIILTSYAKFKVGIPWSEIKELWRDYGFKNQSNFKLAVEEKCEYKKKQVYKHECWRMILKKEYYSLYDDLVEKDESVNANA